MPKQICVVGAALVRANRVLAMRRGTHKALPGMWEFPGGKIEAGETAPEALKRELKEELRIEVEVQRLLTTTEHRYEFGPIALTIYLGRLVGEEPVMTEHSAMRWLTQAELLDVEWAPADMPAVRVLLAEGIT